MIWRFEIVPPPGETRRVVVERLRRVAGQVDFRNGHMVRDCLKRASMVAADEELSTAQKEEQRIGCMYNSLDFYLHIVRKENGNAKWPIRR